MCGASDDPWRPHEMSKGCCQRPCCCRGGPTASALRAIATMSAPCGVIRATRARRGETPPLGRLYHQNRRQGAVTALVVDLEAEGQTGLPNLRPTRLPSFNAHSASTRSSSLQHCTPPRVPGWEEGSLASIALVEPALHQSLPSVGEVMIFFRSVACDTRLCRGYNR